MALDNPIPDKPQLTGSDVARIARAVADEIDRRSVEKRAAATRCTALTKKGIRCRGVSMDGSGLCWHHAAQERKKPPRSEPSGAVREHAVSGEGHGDSL